MTNILRKVRAGARRLTGEPPPPAMQLDHKVYFDCVKKDLFGGSLTQQQVDGQEAILLEWEEGPRQSDDLRHLAYMLATTKHETASTMWPIEEYGKGEGASYGKPDPETGQTYYGRGYVQLTWRDNYSKATQKLGLEGSDDIEWHAEQALDPLIAADVMFKGMWEGWFRSGNDLFKYFNKDTDDAFNAREIINGDKNYSVSWDSRTIGEIIESYHDSFLNALEEAVQQAPPQPRPPRPPYPPRPRPEPQIVQVTITTPPTVKIHVDIVEK